MNIINSSLPPPSLTQPFPAPPPSVPTFPLPSAAPINPPSTSSASSQPHLPPPSTSLAFPSPPSTTDASQTTASQSAASLSPVDWSLSEDFRQRCTSQFNDLKPENGLLKGETARNFFVQSRLSIDELSKIWYAFVNFVYMYQHFSMHVYNMHTLRELIICF